MKPTYTTEEIVNLIRDCSDFETACALEYIVHAEKKRYSLIDLWSIKNQIAIRVNEIRGTKEWQ